MIPLLLRNPLRLLDLVQSGEDPRNDAFFQDRLDLMDIPLDQHPIVLIHGFMGWGRDEPVIPTPLQGDLKYWGGFTHDIERYLNNQGLQVATASVGPISSVWDRACELYAQLTGTRVDYGRGHADHFGHERFGNHYEKPLIPSWTMEKARERNKVHLITHSMGGLTGRLLIHLLEHGSPEEESYHRHKFGNLKDLSPLFRTGHPKPWVRSLTTLSTPHDGTSLLDALARIEENGSQHPQAFFATLAAVVDLNPLPPFCFYDADMAHWGRLWDERTTPRELISLILERFAMNFGRGNPHPWNPEQESWQRIYQTTDISVYDLSPAGARVLNGWVGESPQVYYLSYTTLATEADWVNRDPPTGAYRHHGVSSLMRLSNLDFPPPLAKRVLRFTGARDNRLGPGGQPSVNFSRLMGGYLDLESANAIDPSWWPNDGIVNVKSMDGPKLGREKVDIVPYDGNELVKGHWNHMGTLYGWDHFDITGLLDMEKTHWVNQSDHWLEALTRFGLQNFVVPAYTWIRGGAQREKHALHDFYNHLVQTLLTKAR